MFGESELEKLLNIYVLTVVGSFFITLFQHS